MNRRRELCRNFQRGSCQFGDRCKFLHGTQPQAQSKLNPFGFVTQNSSQPPHTAQQQRSNPFGFGVQNNSNERDASNSGARRQVPTKPFENKWTRTSVTNQSQQTEAQPRPPEHKCTDSDSCKRQIADDFKNEAPIWQLTCYGHCKYGPCDISGDISSEELRAAAYEDGKQGLGLQSIVDRERNLLNSKLIEFNSLLRNPFVVSQSPSFAGMSHFPGTSNGMQLPYTQSNGPPSFSSFSQLKASANLGSNIASRAPGIQPSTLFGQPSIPQSVGQSPGLFGGQLAAPRPGASPNPNVFNFSNGLVSTGNQSVQFPATSTQLSGSMNNPLPDFSHRPNVSSNATPSSPIIYQKKSHRRGSVEIYLPLKKEFEV